MDWLLRWKKPFLIWVIRQNPKWLDHYPEFRNRLEQALRDDDDMAFSGLLAEMVFDPRVPSEVDDLRQWFFAHYKYSAWVWVLQMYGYLASILDITSDVDTALFFTQAQMIDGRFEMPPPSPARVLYVFVEWDRSIAFRSIEHIDWGDSDGARQLPPRVDRQSAGCLVGSTWCRQNYYGHLVIARIRLTDDCVTTKRVADVFPPPDQDLLLTTLLDARPRPEGLYW